MIMFWFLFLGWEISRKIRYVEEESAYITYSRLFGPYKAASIALFIQSISFGLALYLYSELSLSPVCPVLIFLGYFILVRQYFRFFTKRLPEGIKLRNSAELYASLMMLAIIIESLTGMV